MCKSDSFDPVGWLVIYLFAFIDIVDYVWILMQVFLFSFIKEFTKLGNLAVEHLIWNVGMAEVRYPFYDIWSICFPSSFCYCLVCANYWLSPKKNLIHSIWIGVFDDCRRVTRLAWMSMTWAKEWLDSFPWHFWEKLLKAFGKYLIVLLYLINK